ncbi:MAG: hypothetical protein ACXVR1_17025, partial [Solirubrobacteraceae bacterium]
PLDISGSDFAVGASVHFLAQGPNSTWVEQMVPSSQPPQPLISFTVGNPENGGNAPGTVSSGTGASAVWSCPFSQTTSAATSFNVLVSSN